MSPLWHLQMSLLLFLGKVLSTPADDFLGIIHEGELAISDGKYLKNIMPRDPLQRNSKHINLEEDVRSDNAEYFQSLYKVDSNIKSGHITKGLTFNLYDDDMRESAIALFKVFKLAINITSYLKTWAAKFVNKDIVEYSLRLASLYKYENIIDIPPFITKPNYFVSCDTINKALKLKIINGKFDEEEGIVNGYNREENIVTLNTNYSGWNDDENDCHTLNYFREDIGLNSYYYGVHLMYPFWMSDEDLSEVDPRYTEHYYFVHKQLLARLHLEEKCLEHPNYKQPEKCLQSFEPFLVYDNGMPFPTRLNHSSNPTEFARIKAIDTAIREYIDKGFVNVTTGEFNDPMFLRNPIQVKMNLTENNYVHLLVKLIRANYEGPEVSKLIRGFYGYGSNSYPIDRYNPAPSVLHHPETSLRDPIYWTLIENTLDYFLEFAKKLEPYELAEHVTGDYEIISTSFSKITTHYHYYKFRINDIFGDDYKDGALVFAARQKRLSHLPFTLNFTVSSLVNRTGNVRLFLGPQCGELECWRQYHRFFEVDVFPYTFVEGLNYVSWSSETSSRYSFDDYYNLESEQAKVNRYDMYKFPANMMVPKGTESGLNFTLFVMITPQGDPSDILHEPYGFPFHRPAVVDDHSAHGNYRFYNITVFHKKGRKENKGYFSTY